MHNNNAIVHELYICCFLFSIQWRLAKVRDTRARTCFFSCACARKETQLIFTEDRSKIGL